MEHSRAHITFFKKPKLKRPLLIAGFDGWPNAGNIASDTLNFLMDGLSAEKFAEIDPDPFYKYSDVRPSIRVEEGRIINFCFSPYEFYYCQGSGNHDVILFSGNEPELSWHQFSQLFFSLAMEFSVEVLLTVGGTYDYITHNQDPVVSGVYNDIKLRQLFVDAGVKPAEYHGPMSIHTLLLMEGRKKGIDGFSMWGHVPQYLQSNNLPIIYQMLVRLQDLGDFDLDLSDLQYKARELQKQINILVQKSPELSRIIEKMEKGMHSEEPVIPPETKKDKVIDISEFVKKDHSGSKEQ